MADGTNSPVQRETLHAYAAGKLGTRVAIERLGMRDYADLLIALAEHDFSLPRPTASRAHEAGLSRASAILQPRLRHGA